MTTIIKKWLISLLFIIFSTALVSCNDWLDVLPNNEQVTDAYWQSKEDVEAVIASGYYYLRECVPQFIKWGELRGGSLYTLNTGDGRLQDFTMTSSHALCDWSTVYKVIGLANSVLLYGPGVEDDTYYASMRNSHLAEASFLRDYCLLLLVKNYRDVPLVLQAYVNDNASFDLAKSPEKEIIARIKEDVKAILATGAAKGTYEEEWATKGRVTKWALYALMADACLWSEDYDECIKYCDLVLGATDAFRPAFMSNVNDWYSLFYPGNSNESIFELNWDYAGHQQGNNFASLFTPTGSPALRPTPQAVEKMKNENSQFIIHNSGLASNEGGRMGRMLLATFVPDNGQVSAWQVSSQLYVWKYHGTDVADISGGSRQHQDANFIIYRVAELMLMKAQALVMKGESSWGEAISLVNRIRSRAGLPDYDKDVSETDELGLLEEILDQKEMEFMAEGKRWYDLLWLGRIGGGKYKEQMIGKVVAGNVTTNEQWVRSVLQDENAWYLPIPQADIEHNKLLEQNPYY